MQRTDGRTDGQDPNSRAAAPADTGGCRPGKEPEPAHLHTGVWKQLSWEAGRPASWEPSPRPSVGCTAAGGRRDGCCQSPGVAATFAEMGARADVRGRRAVWVSSGRCVGAVLDPGESSGRRFLFEGPTVWGRARQGRR